MTSVIDKVWSFRTTFPEMTNPNQRINFNISTTLTTFNAKVKTATLSEILQSIPTNELAQNTAIIFNTKYSHCFIGCAAEHLNGLLIMLCLSLNDTSLLLEIKTFALLSNLNCK